MRGLKAPISGNISLDLYRPTAGDGCVLWLPGQDDPQSATIRDRSGNKNHGTISGATWTRLPSGIWCLNFDGTDDYVDIANPATFKFTTSFSAILWVKMDTVVTSAKILNVFVSDWNGWFLGVEAATAVYAFEGRYPSARVFKVLTGTITLGQWYHIVAVYDSVGGTAKLYVNAGTPTSAAASGTIAYTGVTKASIGARLDPSAMERFDGLIALPRIRNIVLSATQIANSFNQERYLFGV